MKPKINVKNQDKYPVPVIHQAQDENELVTNFATMIFKDFCQERLKRFSDEDLVSKTPIFPEGSEHLILRKIFSIADLFRQGVEIDYATRLEQINERYRERTSSSGLIIPDAASMRPHLQMHIQSKLGINEDKI